MNTAFRHLRVAIGLRLPRAYTSPMSSPALGLDVRPVTPSFGAEVFGLDLANPTRALIDTVESLFATFGVLFFRDQAITPSQQVALTAALGPVLRVPYIKHLDDHPDVIAVLKEADEQKISTFGGTWHSDFSFLDEPPSATLLYAVEIPSVGGDTLWANQYLAYESLSSGMKELLDPLTAIQTAWPHGTRGPGAGAAVSRSVVMTRNDPGADREIIHPVVRVHPTTGRKALFVNPVYTERFTGMTVEESTPLLRYLFDHAVRPEFVCRLRWTPGTLAMWDNRCLLHLAVNDYDGQRRLLHRTTVSGDRPIGACGPVP